MHRIEGPTADENNHFRPGDPQLGVPATKLSPDWFNDVQENLAKFIEAQDIVLEKGNWDQLTSAILAAQSTFQDNTPIKIIQNNRAAWTDLAGMVFDKTKIKSVLFRYDLQRKTDSTDLLEGGSFRISVKSGTWVFLPGVPSGDDAGTEWDVDAVTGQVKYKSSSLAGLDYEGKMYLKIEKYLL
jgi:hypothetical protein